MTAMITREQPAVLRLSCAASSMRRTARISRSKRQRQNPDDEAGQVCGRLRSLGSITIMLVNDRKESPVKANRCIFQAKIKISSENNDFIFVERNCVNLTLRFPIYPTFHTSSHPQSLHQPHKSSQLLLRHRPQPDGDGFLPQPVTLPGGQVQANIQYTYVSNRKSTIFFCRIPPRLMRSSVSVDNTSFS